MRCPHCGGPLKLHPNSDIAFYEWQRRQNLQTDYDCMRCDRGWRIERDESWHAIGSAGMEIYQKSDVEDMQNHPESWRD